MKRFFLFTAMVLCSMALFTFNSCQQETGSEKSPDPDGIEMARARKEIERNVKQFAEDFNKGDSVALAAHYASDGTFGSVKGDALVTTWGSSIRHAVANGMPRVRFTTESLFSDGVYLVELGKYEFTDTEGNAKSSGKYLVVWKEEDGEWKMYRDIGL